MTASPIVLTSLVPCCGKTRSEVRRRRAASWDTSSAFILADAEVKPNEPELFKDEKEKGEKAKEEKPPGEKAAAPGNCPRRISLA